TLKTPPHLEEGQQMPVSSPKSLEETQPVGLSKERTEVLQEKLKQFHTGQTGEMNRTQAPKEDTKEIPKGKLDPFAQMHSKESVREEEEEQSPLPEKEETIADGDYEFEEFTSLDQADEFAGAFKKTFHRGVWKLVGLAVVFLISLGFSLLGNLEGTPLEEFGPMVPCIVQLVCAVLGFGLALDRIKNGFVTLRPSKASRDSLISLAMVMVIVFSVVLLVVDPQALQASGVYLYVPVVLFELLFGAIGRLMEYRTIITNFKVVSAPAQYDKYSVTIEKNQSLAEDLVRPGGLEERAWMAESRKADFLTGFVKESLGNQFGDKTVKVTTPIFLILSLLAGVLSFFLGDIYTAFTVFTGSLAVSAGAIGLFLTAFPLYTTAKTLSRMGGAVLGGRAMEQFEGVNSLVLDAADLFYPKNITLYGIKTFSNMPIDHAILDATSVLCRTKSVLGCVFLKIIGNHTNYLSPVDSISYEDGMGISAWVNDRRILIGSRELMIHHGIDVPSKDYENRYLEQNRNLVYLSASGELSGVFVLGLGYSEDIRNMLIDLYNNNVLAVVRTVDPILTQQRLAQIFDLPLETFAVVPSRLSKELDASLEPAQTAPALVCHNGRLASQIYSVLCAKVLGRPIHAGRWLYLISAGLGVALFVLFTLLGGVGQISNLFLCIYELISALLCLGVQYAGRLK
ncbi:MAG TPA: cation-translocating P-type ATPase, partial [Candidatus Egerieicola pullicola]|nr:cation-translocating P-type ATPase [Candidatus Egerieicola pullicola]